MTVTQDQVTAGLQELSLGLFELYLASTSPGATVKMTGPTQQIWDGD